MPSVDSEHACTHIPVPIFSAHFFGAFMQRKYVYFTPIYAYRFVYPVLKVQQIKVKY